ncbi:hypothetical protein H0H93_009749 [Arthromyces matolae]|nr:hypothetical protein H0H93_009749 [Arthromyces matolae]
MLQFLGDEEANVMHEEGTQKVQEALRAEAYMRQGHCHWPCDRDCRPMSASHLQRLALHPGTPSKQLIETYPPYDDKDHLQYYGFPVSKEWVYEFAPTCTPIYEHDDVFLILNRVVSYLQDVVGSDQIDYQAVKVDGEVPPNTTVYEGVTGVKYICIISMCAFYKESWQRRPTVAQVRKLEQIIGRKPSWWTDLESIECYQ